MTGVHRVEWAGDQVLVVEHDIAAPEHHWMADVVVCGPSARPDEVFRALPGCGLVASSTGDRTWLMCCRDGVRLRVRCDHPVLCAALCYVLLSSSTSLARTTAAFGSSTSV
jgi:hypothetical protein